jgi:hypothetical protein
VILLAFIDFEGAFNNTGFDSIRSAAGRRSGCLSAPLFDKLTDLEQQGFKVIGFDDDLVIIIRRMTTNSLKLWHSRW